MSKWDINNKTVVSLGMGDTVQTWTTCAPCNDVPINDLINAFYSHLISFGYDPQGVLGEFKDFAEIHSNNNLDISSEEYSENKEVEED